MVVLRDGRKIIGTMRCFDQFSNIVLEQALERVIVGTKFGDVPLGLYVIRGENVVLLGQLVRPPLLARPATPSPRGCRALAFPALFLLCSGVLFWRGRASHPRRVRVPTATRMPMGTCQTATLTAATPTGSPKAGSPAALRRLGS